MLEEETEEMRNVCKSRCFFRNRAGWSPGWIIKYERNVNIIQCGLHSHQMSTWLTFLAGDVSHCPSWKHRLLYIIWEICVHPSSRVFRWQHFPTILLNCVSFNLALVHMQTFCRVTPKLYDWSSAIQNNPKSRRQMYIFIHWWRE